MGNKILFARKAAGMTRQQVTDIMLIPSRTIDNWEREKARPSAWVEKLVIDKLRQIAREKNMKTELNIDDHTYTTAIEEIDLDDREATLVQFLDGDKIIAGEWLNSNGLTERTDSNGPQECDPELYYKLIGAVDERVAEIGTRLGHKYGRNSYGVLSLLDDPDDELIQTIKRVLG